MNADFLGNGWNYPVALNRDQRISMTAGEESISQAIWIILATAPGERVLRPTFGCGIHDLVFSVNDAKTRTQVSQTVQRALVLWEPRINVLDVAVETKDRGEVMLINIQYRVRATNNLFNMVFPFYLEQTSL